MAAADMAAGDADNLDGTRPQKIFRTERWQCEA